MTTREVLDHHLGAFTAGDIDGLLQDYTDESVIMTADGIVRADGLRAAFEHLLTGLFSPATYRIDVDAMHVEGDVAFIVWHAECAGADVVMATDTFVVHDGKIAVQTFAAKVVPSGG
jgi:ketosteroid isomerase-like protein